MTTAMAFGRTVRRPSGWRLRASVAAVVAAMALCGASVAAALMNDSGHAAQTLSTNALAAPTNPSAVNNGCTVATATNVLVSWTATSSTWADGYQVARSLLATGPFVVVGTVTGRTNTSYVDTTVTFSTTYYYVVRATKLSWRSPYTSAVAVTTPSPLCVL